MKYIYLFLALFLFAGCSDTPEEMDVTTTTVTLQASVEKNTRVGFDAMGAFYWSQGDQLGVDTSNGHVDFTITSGVGTGSAEFKAESVNPQTLGDFVVYPASMLSVTNGLGNVTLNLPATYTYTQLDADYFSSVKGEGNSFNALMWGRIENNATTVKHLGGVFCVKVTELAVGDNMKMEFSTGQKINGEYEVALTEPTPVINAVASATPGDNKVTFTFSNSVENGTGVFYIPVGVGTYDNIHIKTFASDGKELKDNTILGTHTIKRCDLYPISATAEPDFPDENFKTYLLGECDKDNNKELSQEEMDAVTVLHVNNKYISSLKGVEKFKNLQELQCQWNKITSLDLSQNLNLEKLVCWHNQITSLVLPHSSKLREIVCNDNQLQSLDVSHNPELTSINCQNNGITSMDVSQNTKLQGLNLQQNKLIKLDVSKHPDLNSCNVGDNPQLTELLLYKNSWALADLNCKNTGISKLDLSGCENLSKIIAPYCPNLTSVNTTNCKKLQELDLSNCNQLPSIDISTNRSLSTLKINNCPNLKFAYIWTGFDETSLSIDKTNSPVQFVLPNETFPDTNFREYVMTKFDTNKDGVLSQEEKDAVKWINVNGQMNIYSLKGIEEFKNINTLRCSHNKISSLDVSIFPDLLILDCSMNKLTTLDVTQNPKLVELDCFDNLLTTIDVSKNLDLEVFWCGHNLDLQSFDVSVNTKLKELYCMDLPITSLDVSHNLNLSLINSNSCKSLTSLDVSMLPHLLELNLQYCTNITTLNMRGCPNLRKLNIDHCEKLTTAYVWDGFDANTQFYENELKDQYCPVQWVGPVLFPDPNFKAYVMSTFDKDNNGILSQEERDAVQNVDVYNQHISSVEGIELFKNLKNLNCANNTITSLDLSQNLQLTKLTCTMNQISELDLSKNVELLTLNCSDNPISTLDVSTNGKLTEVYCGSTNIKVLDFNNNPNIKDLSLVNNPELTTLNIEKCSKLDRLIANKCPKLANFTLAYATKLTYIEMKENLALTSLDTSKCPELVNLYLDGCINLPTTLDFGVNPNLMVLHVSYNPNITTVDISKNTKISTFYCDECPELQTVYVWEGFDESKLTISKYNSPKLKFVVKK